MQNHTCQDRVDIQTGGEALARAGDLDEGEAQDGSGGTSLEDSVPLPILLPFPTPRSARNPAKSHWGTDTWGLWNQTLRQQQHHVHS